jgi:DNA topoisomerase-1
MNLIVVESPTKAKTIAKFLGKEYKVESSFGHIKDLPKSEMGIDIENNFIPKYIIPTKARKTVTNLKALAKKADEVILASDEDREGEAIAWHLAQTLNLDQKKTKRIAFHEITKEAILEALKNPRLINQDMVDAQQARRILDRLVGYELSPFLWKKVAKGLSAGRVQSVALKLIVDREREIKAFVPEEYWTIGANLKNDKQEKFLTELFKINNDKLDKFFVKDDKKADELKAILEKASFSVDKIEKKQLKKSAPRPFATSSLQQTANRYLGFSAKQTMMIAQKLYEGISLGKKGSVGLITYMRTDSFNLSDKFLSEAHDYLKNNFGEKYCLENPKIFKTKSKNAQEAHEAIRPTNVGYDPESIKDYLDRNQYRLYKLIWQRSLASQMPDALLDGLNVEVKAEANNENIYYLRTSGQVLIFDGYLKVYSEKTEDIILPELKQGQALDLIEILPEQHFTQAQARYSDATLVKELEKHGIGRPSTYAPTISTLEDRNYCTRDEKKRLAPTDIAFIVIDLLVSNFSSIVNLEFTAKMEDDLDEIASGKIAWQPVLSEFYYPFHENLLKKYEEIKKEDVMPEEKTDEVCEKCGSPMIVKFGRFGKFLACSNFPDCRNIKSLSGDKKKDEEKNKLLEEVQEKYKDEVCEKCGSPMIAKSGRFGIFLSCSAYPKCKTIKNLKENNNSTGITCPVCKKGEIIKKMGRRGAFYACDQYPTCKTLFSGRPTGEKCSNCGSLMIESKGGQIICSNKCGSEKKKKI